MPCGIASPFGRVPSSTKRDAVALLDAVVAAVAGRQSDFLQGGGDERGEDTFAPRRHRLGKYQKPFHDPENFLIGQPRSAVGRLPPRIPSWPWTRS